jgi:carboxylesterase type B
MSSAILYHPVLGPLQGYFNSSQKVTEYRNIKYASIPARFQDPIPITYRPVASSQHAIDCMKFGPSCPQHSSGFAYDVALVGEVPEMHEEMDKRRSEASSNGGSDTDELKCLDLVVTVPEGSRDELLPVMVWYVSIQSRQ